MKIRLIEPFRIKGHVIVAFQSRKGIAHIMAKPYGKMDVMLLCKFIDGSMRPFKSDGCTLSPDFNFRMAGVLHDARYWIGGTAADRRLADLEFRLNIQDHAPVQEGRKAYNAIVTCAWFALSWVYWIGVRLGGVPWLPLPWRWGFGRPGWAWSYDR